MDANQLAFYNQTNANFAALNAALTNSLSTISVQIDNLINNIAVPSPVFPRSCRERDRLADARPAE